MSVPPSSYNCVCGGTYSTRAGLAQHQRRYCTRAPSEDLNRCPLCDGSFRSFAGMRQHMQLSHAEEYNRDLETESRGARAPWTADEKIELARAEAEYEEPSAGLYEYLMGFSRRTKDALKGRRRMASYKALVQQHREQHHREANAQSPRAPEHQEPTPALQSVTALRLNIAAMDTEHLDNAAVAFQSLAVNGSTAEAVAELERWCASLINRFGGNRRGGRARNGDGGSRANLIRLLRDPTLRPRRRRRLEYKLTQLQYSGDQKAYAERLLDGRALEGEEGAPTPEDLAACLGEVFSTPSAQDSEPIYDRRDQETNTSYPVSLDELPSALNASKSNAAGFDGMTMSDLKRIPKHQLLLLYNSFLLLGTVPQCLKRGRTILIPKKDKELRNASNWRPLTIAPVIARLFYRILAARLSTVELHPNQRGFTKMDGCFANYATIETIIKHRRKRGKPLSLVFLDLSKAFDMLSHRSIGRALERLNIDPVTRRLIDHSYKDCTTVAQCELTHIGEFAVNRGVKQGDPHSPFLFNAVLDELICSLERKTGIKMGAESKICVMAYADNIVLMAEDPADAQRMLDEALAFLSKRGLKINVGKSCSLILRTVPSKKKLYTATEPVLHIGDELIPTTTIGESFSYLGQKFSSTGSTPCTAEALSDQLSRIKRAPLKPQQKLNIICKYLTPRYISSLQRPNVNKKILREVDRKIRAATRQVLSLCQHCSNAIFYASRKNGGLGLYCMTDNIPTLILTRWEKIRGCSSLLERTFQQSQPWVSRLKRIAPADAQTKEMIKTKYSEALEASFSGGLRNIQHHRACREIIGDPPRYWSGQNFVRAVNLRYNLLPCKSMPSVPVEERRCRAGCDRAESLSHILQRCPLVHWNRIQRHDFIARRIKNCAVARGWTVQMEPNIRCPNGALKKPDLVMRTGDRVIICGVGIHWEGTTTLEDQYHNKVAIYSTQPFIQAMQQKHPHCQILVLPLIIGARGTWCQLNEALEKELQLNVA